MITPPTNKNPFSLLSLLALFSPPCLQRSRDSFPRGLHHRVRVLAGRDRVVNDQSHAAPKRTPVEPPFLAVGHQRSGADQGHRDHGHARLGRDAEGSLFELRHRPVFRPRPFGEEEHGGSGGEQVAALGEACELRPPVDAVEADVAVVVVLFYFYLFFKKEPPHKKREKYSNYSLSPSQEHRPPDDRNQEVARLRDKLERPPQPKERVDIQERLMVCYVDHGLVELWQLFFPDDPDAVKGRSRGLGPPVVDKVLRAPPLWVEERHERREDEHGGEERHGEGKGHEVEGEPFQVRE